MNYLTDSNIAFIEKLCNERRMQGLTWTDVANTANAQLGFNYSADWYRHKYWMRSKNTTITQDEDDVSTSMEEKVESLLREVRKEKVRLADERTQINSNFRRLSREETLKDIAREAVENISKNYPMLSSRGAIDYNSFGFLDEDHEAVVVISDWHYGVDVDSHFNKYNPEIVIERINKLKSEVLTKCAMHHVTKVHIVNLSDLIAGRIHLQLRINSRYDTVTQTMNVAEILAEFIYDISQIYDVEYYDCDDNHSRIEPNKKESLELESFTRIIKWYLKERFRGNNNINIHDNEFGEDIICFECLNHIFAGVHGDKSKDKPNGIIKNLSTFLGEEIDVILSAHLHHFSSEEENYTFRISNGSLMGTDDYAQSLRVSSPPSQTLIIVSESNPCECIYKINVE